MLKLSVGKKECLYIGDNVKIVLADISDRIAHVLIDAPREVAIARGKAAGNIMSGGSYRRMKDGMTRAVKEELDGRFAYPDGPMRLTEWIKGESVKDAAFGIYGKGTHARECYNAIFTGGIQKVLVYVNPQRSPNDRNVRSGKIEDLKKPELDYIIVAMQNPDSYREALRELKELGISEQKIVWMPSL